MFREKDVRESFKTLISDNSATLLAGLTLTREIGQITTSALTPPVEYYFIVVRVESVNKKSYESKNTRMSGLDSYIYPVSITVVDYAQIQLVDNEKFETMDKDFQMFTDNIAKLINDQDWFTVSTTKGQLVKSPSDDSDRVINKINYTDFDESGDTMEFALISNISFSIEIIEKGKRS